MTRRLGVRRRIKDCADFARRMGRINRADIARIGEVSITQASADIAMLIEDYPDLGLAYDRSAKMFVVAPLLNPLRAPEGVWKSFQLPRSDMTMQPSLAVQRATARVADKYLTRDAEARDARSVAQQQADETQALEMALEHVRRGLGTGTKGQGARIALKAIEAVLTRDYGLYARIKPDNR